MTPPTRVTLLAAGGTIASRVRRDGAVAVALSGAEVLARAGVRAPDVEVVDAQRGPSWSLSPDAMAALARTAVDHSARAPVVVTHGTDTLEETAFLTWLLGGGRPVVFTGAMRHDDHPDADGPANLREAVALAAGGDVDGPVVHLAGETHHARWAAKTDTTALGAFRSVGGAGTPPPPPGAGSGVVTAVAEVRSHVGMDGAVIGWHLDRGARGIVVQGTGAGNVHGSLLAGIERALGAGVPVVVATRCATGAVAPVYGGPGGGHELAAAGCIPAGDLPPHKARLALWVALGAGPHPGRRARLVRRAARVRPAAPRPGRTGGPRPEPMAYFRRVDHSRFEATRHAGGAWNSLDQHVAPALGLLVHAVERDRDVRRADGLVVARLSFDILGTMPVDVVDAEVRVARPGRTVELVEAALSHAGRVAVILRAWLLRPGDTAGLATSALPPIAPPAATPAWDPTTVWPGGFIESVEVRRTQVRPGRASFWVRTPVALVDDEPASGLARATGLLDIANGMTVAASPQDVAFPNVDLTAHLFAEPRGEWVGFDTTVSFGPAGVGVTHSVVHDVDGPVGTASQCLTVRPARRRV